MTAMLITNVMICDGTGRDAYRGEILGFVGRGNTSSGKLAGWDSVGKLGLWAVHTVLDRFEKEGIINGYWYDLISEHLLSIGARFGQNPKTCVG